MIGGNAAEREKGVGGGGLFCICGVALVRFNVSPKLASPKITLVPN